MGTRHSGQGILVCPGPPPPRLPRPAHHQTQESPGCRAGAATAWSGVELRRYLAARSVQPCLPAVKVTLVTGQCRVCSAVQPGMRWVRSAGAWPGLATALAALLLGGARGVAGADLVIRIPGDLSQQDGYYRLDYR